MKVIKVEIFDIECFKCFQWNLVFVCVYIDEGIIGVGEVGLVYDWGYSVVVYMIKEIVEVMLIGFNFFYIELLWLRMLCEGFWGLGGGLVIYVVMSVIDIVFWDIKGKVFGLLVYELLGGKINGKFCSYVSQLQFDWDKEVIKFNDFVDYVCVIEKVFKDGYDVVKVDFIVYDKDGNIYFDRIKLFIKFEFKFFKVCFQVIRDIMGEDGDIIFECYSLLGVLMVIQLGDIVEEIGCLYYEELVNYFNLKFYDKVVKNVNVFIVGGECLYYCWDVCFYFED